MTVTAEESSATSAAPAALAVSGSSTRAGRSRADFADADVRAVLKEIRDAVAKQAPDIAGPVIDKAETDNKITAVQADKLRQAAQDLADGKRPDIRGLGRDSDVQDVIHDAFEAAHDKAPGIAEPIIDKAVQDKQITEAQADRIREMVRRGPSPRGPHGRGGHKFGGLPPFADADVRAVLEDVHEAVAKQADDIAGPIIDKAEQDGKITAAQADRLRDAAGSLAAGKPRGIRPRNLELRDEDVREVLHDVFEAIAAKTPDIAKPIIDKAVEDKKITEAQADQLRNMQRRFKSGPGPATAAARPGRPAPGPPPTSTVPRRRTLRRAASARRALRHTSAAPLRLEGAAQGRRRGTKKLLAPRRPARTGHSRRLHLRRAAPATSPLPSSARRCGRRWAPRRSWLRLPAAASAHEALHRRAEEGQHGREATCEEGLPGRRQAWPGARSAVCAEARAKPPSGRT